MPTVSHTEHHFESSAMVRDIGIGMAGGLTMPFALAAGLTGAVDASRLIVVAGLAEIAAGAIAMGLGGYLAARSDADHYASEKAREHFEVAQRPEDEVAGVAGLLASYGLTTAQIRPVTDALRAHPSHWVDFMMRFELGLGEPDPKRALTSAVTIGGAYVVGGLIPLLPYFALANVQSGLMASAALTLVALLVFGYVKGHFTGVPPLRSALQTALVGGIAA